MAGRRLNTPGQKHIQGNTQVGAAMRKWKAVEVNRITAGLHRWGSANQMLNTPPSEVCSPLKICLFHKPCHLWWAHYTTLPLLSVQFPAHWGSGKSLLPPKGEETEWLDSSGPGCPLVPAPSPAQDSCPRLGSTAWRRARGVWGKAGSAEKEEVVKRTVERRRDMVVKWVQRNMRANQRDCVF